MNFTPVGLGLYIIATIIGFFNARPKQVTLGKVIWMMFEWIAMFAGWISAVLTAVHFKDWVVVPSVGLVIIDIYILIMKDKTEKTILLRGLFYTKTVFVILSLLKYILT